MVNAGISISDERLLSVTAVVVGRLRLHKHSGKQIVSLPMDAELTAEQVQVVVDAVKQSIALGVSGS